MKGRYLSPEELYSSPLKQTAVIVTYTHHKDVKKTRTRILIGGWMSRNEAWEWCVREDCKRKITYKEGAPLERNIKLLRLDKVVRDLQERHPSGYSAIEVIC